ncbi:PRC-barrel domain-containing protein [Nocardioides mangrovi]|uniref:PRC-barrel domain-containing protein n=1 Tax=Nocardioides mangrovi TaxID=2874580 RepID=A0ABS7UIN1_9ACTN|nr:PRC-barrel domain-containing protein [Nocardioides mangrovi]MBZ5740645.1 PRC-barrel domain-containing protein [Nocardioides mangrovi]
MTVMETELRYLAGGGIELAEPAADLRGLVVVGPDGLRIGQVEDLVVDVDERRPRLLVVASGGVLGLAVRRVLVPVETVTRVADRVHLDRSSGVVNALLADRTAQPPGPPAQRPTAPGPGCLAELYALFGVTPFWLTGSHPGS